jgi:hypothetical protein
VDALPGQIVGRAMDTSGAALPGVTVVLEADRSRRVATTGPDVRSRCRECRQRKSR